MSERANEGGHKGYKMEGESRRPKKDGKDYDGGLGVVVEEW